MTILNYEPQSWSLKVSVSKSVLITRQPSKLSSRELRDIDVALRNNSTFFFTFHLTDSTIMLNIFFSLNKNQISGTVHVSRRLRRWQFFKKFQQAKPQNSNSLSTDYDMFMAAARVARKVMTFHGESLEVQHTLLRFATVCFCYTISVTFLSSRGRRCRRRCWLVGQGQFRASEPSLLCLPWRRKTKRFERHKSSLFFPASARRR